jgi:hypothetical protein
VAAPYVPTMQDVKRSKEDQHIIKGWSYGGVLLEFYRYAPGPASALPKHSHEEYQVGLSLDFPGEYYYRGTRYGVPVGSLSIVHPGEVHSARDPEDRHTAATFRMIYVAPTLFQKAAVEISGHTKSLPFFPHPIIMDEDLAGHFLKLHRGYRDGRHGGKACRRGRRKRRLGGDTPRRWTYRRLLP